MGIRRNGRCSGRQREIDRYNRFATSRARNDLDEIIRIERFGQRVVNAKFSAQNRILGMPLPSNRDYLRTGKGFPNVAQIMKAMRLRHNQVEQYNYGLPRRPG